MAIYTVEDSQINSFNKKVQKLQLKGKKNGFEVTKEVLRTYFKEAFNDYGKKVMVKLYDIKVEGEVRFQDWEFIASIEHTENGNIIHSVVDVEIPEKYRTTKGYCDHCKTDRPRKKTYLVKKGDDWFQLGTNCVELYTHGLSSENIKMVKNAFIDLNSFDFNEADSCPKTEYFDSEYILSIAIPLIKKNGYTKKYDSLGGVKPDSTAKIIENILYSGEKDIEVSNDKVLIKKMTSWALSKADENDFFHNLSVILLDKYVSVKNIGILVSLIPTYTRETEVKESQYYGVEGEKVDIDVEKGSVAGSFNSAFGRTYVYKFNTKDNYIFITYTTREFESPELINHITGTIKGFKEYKNEKQTILSRIKVSNVA